MAENGTREWIAADAIEVRRYEGTIGLVLTQEDGLPILAMLDAREAHHLIGRLRKAANDASAALARSRHAAPQERNPTDG